MLLIILGAVLYPFLATSGATKVVSRGKAFRGAVMGLIAAAGVGFFLPTSSVRLNSLSPIHMERQVASDSMQYTAIAMDNGNHIRTYVLPSDKTLVTVDSKATGVTLHECRATFTEPWMHYVGICWDRKTYELEVPTASMDQYLPSAPQTNPVVFITPVAQK